MQWAKNKQSGFTIVELLIVVVVIAILAAITIVAYTGIQNRAKAAASQNTASQSAKKLGVYFTLHGDTYPSALTDQELALPNVNANPSPYQYTVASDLKSYCLTTTVNNISYFISSTSPNPSKGACTGHTVDGSAMVTNLVPNPRPSSSYWFSSSNSVATVSFPIVDGVSVARSTRVTTANYALYGLRSGLATGVEGDTYTALFRIKSSTPSTVAFQVGYGSGSSSTHSLSIETTTSWQTIRHTFTLTSTTTGQPIYPKFLWGTSLGAVNDYFDVSNVMWVKGTYSGNYADGDSSGWTWQGTANDSASTGPLL